MADDASDSTSSRPAALTPKLGPDNGLDRIARIRAQMERTTSESIRAEGKELRQAAEQSLNIILDLTLDGHVRWLSPTWTEIVGTDVSEVLGLSIEDVLIEKKNVFLDALTLLREHGHSSRIVRFSVPMGPKSRWGPQRNTLISEQENGQSQDKQDKSTEEQGVINLEAQGILVYDRSTGEESHVRCSNFRTQDHELTSNVQTMWMIRPAIQREVTIDLPEILVESLGVGAEMLAQHLTLLADAGRNDPENHPPALPVLCRICERQITPWWFPKHTELCLQEHQAEAEVEMSQENLAEQRNHIVKVLDALEARTKHKVLSNTDDSGPLPPSAEYKSMEIGVSSSTSASSSSAVSRSSSHSGSRERSGTIRNHNRARSFTVRRPVSRIVELVLDLCDTAMEINAPTLKDVKGTDPGEFRSQSPQSEGRISQVLQWQSPSAGALESEPGLAALCDDTTSLSKAKVDAIARYRQLLEYSERIRHEFTTLIQECIEAALQKAGKIAAGESDDDSSDDSTSKGEQSENDPGEQSATEERGTPGLAEPTPIHVDRPSAMASALRSSISGRSVSLSPHRRVSTSLSQRSSSSRECPTPRSRAAAQSGASQEKRSSTHADIDIGTESDGSVRSSVQSQPRRAESPSPDIALSRVPSSRERKRTSLVLPQRTGSISRSHSPGRPGQPQSPLRVPKPRITSAGQETAVKSPLMSPTLSSSEFCSPTLPAQQPQQQPYQRHRRQSSTNSSEMSRTGVSPHLTMTSGPPQPRAAPPSIKDFEIIKPISKGAFGSVYLAKKKSTGEYYAIKALKKADMISKNQVANVKAERAILMWQEESDFVAKLYWTFPSKDYIFLVMEYLNGGDCASLLRVLGTLSEDWAKKYLAEVVLGVEHLHSRQVVHRDLKPDNLLIDQKGHLKLTDFGLSRMGLIGRQKRALNAKQDQLQADPLKQGPFARATSIASSRSASFDVNTGVSPCNTPNLTPASGDIVPSYFSLTREPSISSREPTRQNSSHRSESADSDFVNAAFRRLSIFDELAKQSPLSEESSRDERDTHDGQSIHRTDSVSKSHRHSNPLQNAMLPPSTALFDPDDGNRRFVGTPDYLAPETINGLGQDEVSDWWSIGCILFEFLFGYPPFQAPTPDKVFDNILSRRIDWPHDDTSVSDEAKDIMNKLMTLNPQERLGANIGDMYDNGGEEIRAHPWFADIDWDAINEAEPSFVPAPENPEDTEYFDSRGATTETFVAEFEDQNPSPNPTPGADYPDRPHDALSKVRSQFNGTKRGLMPLHIPKHVREGGRSRRLSEPGNSDDFGQFSYKNLPVLEKANKDVIQKLRAEAMQAQSRPSQQPPPKSAGPTNPSPPTEGSPFLPPSTLGRTLSQTSRPKSPSGIHNPTTSSPGRVSQPSSPLVQFSAGGHHERRKTSTGSSQASASLQPGGFFDVPPRFISSCQTNSSTSSPVKSTRSSDVLELELVNTNQLSAGFGSSPRTRSRTVGAREGETLKETVSKHQKHRSQILDISPSSSDNDDARQKALMRVRQRRQSSRRMSQINFNEGPFHRPLDVLVCEDHPVSKIVISTILEGLRCRAMIVSDGREATQTAMGSVKFDIIMMEFKLPQTNGFDVARMLRETKNTNRDTPIVAVTGYVKELQAPHHFSALIEKPPTQAKVAEVFAKLCHWKQATPGLTAQTHPLGPSSVPPSSLRNESMHSEESPTSTSSGFQTIPSSWRSSSREDSVSSGSVFTDPDPRPTDAPVIVTGLVDDEVKPNSHGGLGITGGLSTDLRRGTMHPIAALKHEDSAPAALNEMNPMKKQRSAEAIDAKRKALTKFQSGGGGDLGDDEDEELGKRTRSRSPRGKSKAITPAK